LISYEAAHQTLAIIWLVVVDLVTKINEPHPPDDEKALGSDASEDQVGGVTSNPYVLSVHEFLPQDIIGTSSTLHKLFGLFLVLLAFQVHGVVTYADSISVLADNLGASIILYVGSAVFELQLLAELIITELSKYRSWRARWSPRTSLMIVECDRISKLDDLCDYELAQWAVVLLQKMWGRFTIDRCATVRSCKVFSRSGRPMFNSRFATRLSLGGDFRRQFDWARHFNYVNPPFALIPDAINCVFVQRAQAVLIVPHDSTATWWPILQVGQLGIRDV
jgi:hypothetical protein